MAVVETFRLPVDRGVPSSARSESPVLARLGDISVPTLIVVGEHDIADVHAHCGAIEAAIPAARRVILPDSGHLSHLEVPDVFNAVVLDFLTSQLPKSQPS